MVYETARSSRTAVWQRSAVRDLDSIGKSRQRYEVSNDQGLALFRRGCYFCQCVEGGREGEAPDLEGVEYQTHETEWVIGLRDEQCASPANEV